MTDAQRIAGRLLAYYSPKEMAEWLCSPHPQLGDDLPAAVIAWGDVSEVDAVLDRLDSDGYI